MKKLSELFPLAVGNVVEKIVPGTNVTVDETNKKRPIVSSLGGGGGGGNVYPLSLARVPYDYQKISGNNLEILIDTDYTSIEAQNNGNYNSVYDLTIKPNFNIDREQVIYLPITFFNDDDDSGVSTRVELKIGTTTLFSISRSGGNVYYNTDELLAETTDAAEDIFLLEISRNNLKVYSRFSPYSPILELAIDFLGEVETFLSIVGTNVSYASIDFNFGVAEQVFSQVIRGNRWSSEPALPTTELNNGDTFYITEGGVFNGVKYNSPIADNYDGIILADKTDYKFIPIVDELIIPWDMRGEMTQTPLENIVNIPLGWRPVEINGYNFNMYDDPSVQTQYQVGYVGFEAENKTSGKYYFILKPCDSVIGTADGLTGQFLTLDGTLEQYLAGSSILRTGAAFQIYKDNSSQNYYFRLNDYFNSYGAEVEYNFNESGGTQEYIALVFDVDANNCTLINEQGDTAIYDFSLSSAGSGGSISLSEGRNVSFGLGIMHETGKGTDTLNGYLGFDKSLFSQSSLIPSDAKPLLSETVCTTLPKHAKAGTKLEVTHANKYDSSIVSQKWDIATEGKIVALKLDGKTLDLPKPKMQDIDLSTTVTLTPSCVISLDTTLSDFQNENFWQTLFSSSGFIADVNGVLTKENGTTYSYSMQDNIPYATSQIFIAANKEINPNTQEVGSHYFPVIPSYEDEEIISFRITLPTYDPSDIGNTILVFSLKFMTFNDEDDYQDFTITTVGNTVSLGVSASQWGTPGNYNYGNLSGWDGTSPIILTIKTSYSGGYAYAEIYPENDPSQYAYTNANYYGNNGSYERIMVAVVGQNTSGTPSTTFEQNNAKLLVEQIQPQLYKSRYSTSLGINNGESEYYNKYNLCEQKIGTINYKQLPDGTEAGDVFRVTVGGKIGTEQSTTYDATDVLMAISTQSVVRIYADKS